MEGAEEKSDGQIIEYVNLIFAIVLAALATPIVKWLVVHGGKLGISNPNAISFCNILFVGNICSGIVVLATFGWRRLWPQLKRLDARTSLLLAGNILIGTVVAPILLYIALETTMVTNLVLLTRIEAVVYSILGVFLFKDPIAKSNWVGLAFITVGTLTLAFVQGQFMKGDGLGLLAGILFAVGSALGRSIVKQISIPAFVFIRNLVGGIVFFCLAIILYGPDHFAHAFSADLWLVMTVYGALVVVLGQMTWFRAVGALSSGVVSAWSTLTPVLGVLFAYLIVHEIPDMSQWITALIIIGGLAVTQIRPARIATTPRIVEKGLAGA